MTIVDRLKMELQKEYLTDENYITLLSENGLTDTDTYDKTTHQRDLLYTVVDVLEIVSNDIDLMRKVETDFATTSEASAYLEKRIEKIKQRIYEISDDETDSNITLLFRKSY